MVTLTSDQYLKKGRFIQKIKNKYFSPKTSQLTQKEKGIIVQLALETKNRSRKEINDWRRGIRQAEDPEEPRRYILHDLYDDLKTDGHLQSLIQTRELATLSTRYYIANKKDGNEIPEKTELLEKAWFIFLMRDCIESIITGFRVIELRDRTKMSFEAVPGRNVIPEKSLVVFEATGDEGVFYDTPEWDSYLIRAGQTKDLGIMNDIVPQLIWKRNAQQSWAEFSEKFGIPLVSATTNKTSDKDLARIQYMLEQLGEAAQAVLPEGTTIDIKEGASASRVDVYDKQIERCNSEMSKRILGGTMVSDNGSSRSQSEVHERTLDDKIAGFDRKIIAFLVNDQVLPLLAKHGMPFTENDKFVFDEQKKRDLNKLWEIVNEILDKYDVPDEWVSKTFNIPIEGRKKQEAKPKSGVSANFKPPLLGGLAGAVRFPNYIEEKNGIVEATGVRDQLYSKIAKESEKILKQLWDKGETDPYIIAKTLMSARILQKGLFSGWKNRNTLNYDATDHVALAFMEHNLFHFSYAREIGTLQELNQWLVNKDKMEIRSFTDFKAAAAPLLKKVDGNWLKTEYKFTVATAQNASSFNRHWNERETVGEFIQFQTVGDSNVRHDHRLLHGKVFNINDPEARRLYPPLSFGCRCEFGQYVGVPKNVMKGADGIALLDMDEKLAKKMLVNRGELKQVFTANQFYVENSGFAKESRKLDYSKYGLKPFSEMKGLKKLAIDPTINKSNAKELFKPEKGGSYMGHTDYVQRKMKLQKADFDKNTKTNAGLFPHVEEVLNNPDEVYMVSPKEGTISFRYVKAYDKGMLVVDTEVTEKAGHVINGWQLTSKDTARKGLLINKNM